MTRRRTYRRTSSRISRSAWVTSTGCAGHGTRVTAASSQRVGAVVTHRLPPDWCQGAITFDVPAAAGLSAARWKVERWDPHPACSATVAITASSGTAAGSRCREMRFTITCELCGCRMRLARLIYEPQTFSMICHGCEAFLSVTVTAEKLRDVVTELLS